jgi:hypothetical protein
MIERRFTMTNQIMSPGTRWATRHRRLAAVLVGAVGAALIVAWILLA